MTAMIRLILTIVLGLATATAGADSMRCGGKVISIGMSMSEVLQYCGEPASKEIEEHDVRSGNRVTGTTQLHRWTYSDYSRVRVLEFDQDKLLSIR
jgi:hypothetical protein